MDTACCVSYTEFNLRNRVQPGILIEEKIGVNARVILVQGKLLTWNREAGGCGRSSYSGGAGNVQWRTVAATDYVSNCLMRVSQSFTAVVQPPSYSRPSATCYNLTLPYWHHVTSLKFLPGTRAPWVLLLAGIRPLKSLLHCLR
jgi:hypothetical protein